MKLARTSTQAAVADFHAYTSGKLTAEEVTAIAAARAQREREIENEECAAGAAIRHQYVKLGGIHACPPKKRQATASCSRENRKAHSKMVAVPQ
jgi:hypothetical protein